MAIIYYKIIDEMTNLFEEYFDKSKKIADKININPWMKVSLLFYAISHAYGNFHLVFPRYHIDNRCFMDDK